MSKVLVASIKGPKGDTGDITPALEEARDAVTAAAADAALSRDAAAVSAEQAASAAVDAVADADIPGQVSAGITSSPTVTAAAQAAAVTAVNAEVAGRDIIEGTDPRVPQYTTLADVLVAETDRDGRASRIVDREGRTWIRPAPGIITEEAYADGSLPIRAAGPTLLERMLTPLPDMRHVAGFTDGVRLSELVVDEKGAVPSWAARRIVSRGMTPAAFPGAVAGPGIVGWGDSMIWHGSTNGVGGWLGDVAAALGGVEYFNAGWVGQFAAEIAARMGATRTRLNFPGGVLPASGGVNVTLSSANPVGGSITPGRTIDGYLVTARGPIRGTLQRPDTSTTTFTRTDPGEAVTFASAPVFFPTAEQSRSDWVHLFWAGRNGPDSSDNLAMIQAMVAMQTAGRKRFLVLEVAPWYGSGTPFADTLNLALAEAFPAQYVPVATWLRTDAAATAAGITFTSDDLADIAAGYTPRSFRDDGVHLSAAGRKAVAAFITQTMIQKGWYQL